VISCKKKKVVSPKPEEGDNFFYVKKDDQTILKSPVDYIKIYRRKAVVRFLFIIMLVLLGPTLYALYKALVALHRNLV
jgi:hypothetical protein